MVASSDREVHMSDELNLESRDGRIDLWPTMRSVEQGHNDFLQCRDALLRLWGDEGIECYTSYQEGFEKLVVAKNHQHFRLHRHYT